MSVPVAFVVNPRAGRQDRSRIGLTARVARAAAAAGLEAEIYETGGRGHAARLAGEAAAQGFAVVAAVGGDGTVNEVAHGLQGTAAALGVVPLGSGNGFARDFGISLDLERACRQIATGRPRRVDLGEVDGRIFLMTAGFGIDARVTHDFDRKARNRRGQLPYFGLSLQAIAGYEPPRLTLHRPDPAPACSLSPLLLVAANTRQFGGGAVIAPAALPDDGRLDFVIVPRMPWWRALRCAAKLFSASIDLAEGVEIFRAAEVEVEGEGPLQAQVDGEALVLSPRVVVRCRPRALALWCPE